MAAGVYLGYSIHYYGPECGPEARDVLSDPGYESEELFVERALGQPTTLTPEDVAILHMVRPEVLESVRADGRDMYAA